MSKTICMLLDVGTGKLDVAGVCCLCHEYTDHASLALSEDGPMLFCDNCAAGAAAVSGVSVYKPAVISWVPQQPEPRNVAIKATETINRQK